MTHGIIPVNILSGLRTTSRPDVCQCLVVRTARDNMSIKCAKYINDHVVVYYMPGLPAYLVQELNVGTVVYASNIFKIHYSSEEVLLK